MAMIVIRAEFSVDDDSIEEWCGERGVDPDDIEDYIYDFAEWYFGGTPFDDAWVI